LPCTGNLTRSRGICAAAHLQMSEAGNRPSGGKATLSVSVSGSDREFFRAIGIFFTRLECLRRMFPPSSDRRGVSVV
jgi:hypothetical protein